VETSTLADRVYEILKLKILTREFTQGQKLNITSVANELNVSNTPVREALSRLEKVGLVTIIPYCGPYVRSLSPSEVAQAYDARIALEELAARLAAISATPATLDTVESCHQEYERALDSGDNEGALEADIGFHQAIAQASGNAILVDLLQNLSDWIRLFMQFRRPAGQRMHTVIQDHMRILEALRERDQEKAGAAMKRHLVAAKDDLIQPLLKQTEERELSDRAAAYPNAR
jgi:DNA-binding GntR family transcriptional regulator